MPRKKAMTDDERKARDRERKRRAREAARGGKPGPSHAVTGGKATASAGPRKRRPRQTLIPGTGEPIPELHNAAEEYFDRMHERIDATRIETAARDNLVAVMKTHRRDRYVDGEFSVQLVTEPGKVKPVVKRVPREEPEAGGGDA